MQCFSASKELGYLKNKATAPATVLFKFSHILPTQIDDLYN